jgi:hypothetical protein
MALESTQPLTEMSTRNLSGCKKRPVRRDDNLAAICEPKSENVGASTSRNPKGLHGLYRDNFTFTCLYIILKLRSRRVQLASNSQITSHYHPAVYFGLLVTVRYNIKRLNSDWSDCTTVLCFCGPSQQVLLIIMQFTQSEFGAVEHRWRASEKWLYICFRRILFFFLSIRLLMKRLYYWMHPCVVAFIVQLSIAVFLFSFKMFA